MIVDALLGLGLAFGIGAGCRYYDLPLPAPPKLMGALLVLSMTLGFVLTDLLLARPAPDSGFLRHPDHHTTLGGFGNHTQLIHRLG